MKASELFEAIEDILSVAGIPVQVKKEEEKKDWKPSVDENGLMNGVEELRDLVRAIHEDTLEFLCSIDDMSLITRIRALGLIETLNAAHDLVCDCKRKVEKK
jgi:hypothetical protein